MSWWMWVLIVIGALVVVFAILASWDPVMGYFREKKRAREHAKWAEERAKMTPAEVEEERIQSVIRRQDMARMQALSGAPTARMMGIADLVSCGDIEGLRRTFSLADSWETRELVVVAFMNLVRDRPETVNAERARLLGALDDIVALSRAETSGGTYRQNCLDQAQSLADRVRSMV